MYAKEQKAEGGGRSWVASGWFIVNMKSYHNSSSSGSSCAIAKDAMVACGVRAITGCLSRSLVKASERL